eukprot:TRINITY_DN5846_c0_g1_i6.p1 TRINITY_DN5846_c0_g1~~TRINITY_DN5846_c0_g1_i6.p1  ORF type:complete len:167 (+),score=32.77 TRINITY_DN5846_c0_g1_i6:574-1074(+)
MLVLWILSPVMPTVRAEAITRLAYLTITTMFVLLALVHIVVLRRQLILPKSTTSLSSLYIATRNTRQARRLFWLWVVMTFFLCLWFPTYLLFLLQQMEDGDVTSRQIPRYNLGSLCLYGIVDIVELVVVLLDYWLFIAEPLAEAGEQVPPPSERFGADTIPASIPA